MTNGGTLVPNFTLATADRYKDKQGEWQEQTEWRNLVAYARGAEIIRDYVRKGSKLYVEGKIKTRSWEDRGHRKEGLPNRNHCRRYQPSIQQRRERQAEQRRQPPGNRDEAEEFGDLGITDADVPF